MKFKLATTTKKPIATLPSVTPPSQSEPGFEQTTPDYVSGNTDDVWSDETTASPSANLLTTPSWNAGEKTTFTSSTPSSAHVYQNTMYAFTFFILVLQFSFHSLTPPSSSFQHFDGLWTIYVPAICEFSKPLYM